MATKDIEVILKKVYPYVTKNMPSAVTKLKKMMSKFMEQRHQYLYDTAPCNRILYTQTDADEFFTAIGVSEKEVLERMQGVYYMEVSNFNPRAAKDPLTIAVLCIIRYFHKKKDKKNTELYSVYLAFTGKFYPSIHSGSYKVFTPEQNRYIMDYVVNNMLTNKFDLKTEKSVLGAVKSRTMTWLDTYSKRLDVFDDEDIVYLIQQLHDRIKSFMKNIADLYFTACNQKDMYLVFNSDDMSDSSYRIADNDSLKIERVVETTMSNINGKTVDWNICKASSDSNVKVDELKHILESILEGNKNLLMVKELIGLIVTNFFKESKTKDVRGIEFIAKSITPKPNTKDPYLLRQKEIVEEFLSNNSTAYNRRKHREPTRTSYHKSLTKYFVLLINKSNS